MLIRTQGAAPPWLDRFEAKIEPEPMSGCWLWTGAQNGPRDCGVFRLGKVYRAHRVSWELTRGAIPTGLVLVHHCSNYACVNPYHLRLSTGRKSISASIPATPESDAVNAKKPLEIRLAWLAGILDGEGSISLNRIRAVAHGIQGWYARFTVRIANTDPAMLNEVIAIAKVLGVKYFCSTFRNNPRKNEKSCPGVVVATKDHVQKFLEALLPYLVTKHERAQLALRAIKYRRTQLEKGSSKAPLVSDSVFQGFVEEMKRHNQRGRIGIC